jgi:hypothetical protein
MDKKLLRAAALAAIAAAPALAGYCPAEGKAIDAAAEFNIGPCRTTA